MEYNQLGESSKKNIQAAKENLPSIIIGTNAKAQKGKCNFCGQYFTPEDIVEIDHIFSTSKWKR